MKSFSKLAFVCTSLFLGMSVFVVCGEDQISETDSSDWLTELEDSLSNTTDEVEDSLSNATADVEEIDGYEDVYTIGETDYSSTFWSAFSKYYQIPDGETWQAQFVLNIDPDETHYYENFALFVTNDVDRYDSDYKEYGVIRFDATSDTLSYNSQWSSDYWDFWFSFTTATLLFSPDDDSGVTNLSSLGGTVTVTVDRSDPDAFTITMTNGTQTKTYAQPYALGNLNSDTNNDTIRCFLAPEGSYINFKLTTIVPIGGLTSADDEELVSMGNSANYSTSNLNYFTEMVEPFVLLSNWTNNRMDPCRLSQTGMADADIHQVKMKTVSFSTDALFEEWKTI